MAWKARITAVATFLERDVLQVQVEYFDDATPAVVLARFSPEYPLGTPIADIGTEIVRRGQSLRDTAAKIASLPNHVGRVINIP